MNQLVPVLWIVLLALIIPFTVFILGLIQKKKLAQMRTHQFQSIEEIANYLETLPDYTLDNLPQIDDAFQSLENPDFEQDWEQIKVDSDRRFSSQWLAPVTPLFQREHLIPRSLIFRLTVGVPTVIGVVSLLCSLALWIYIGTLGPLFERSLALMPLILDMPLVALVAWEGVCTVQAADRTARHLETALCSVVPVYNENSSAALLIQELDEHDASLRDTVQQFTHSARRMAESDFAQGIAQSVRQIMHDEVVPPIREASTALSLLAQSLDQRQSTGMETLASSFSDRVSQSLGTHLNPLTTHLDSVSSLMMETQNYVRETLTGFEQARDTNAQLNTHVASSLEKMAAAREGLSQELNEISQQMEVVSASSEKMANLYAGESESLGQRLSQLSSSLEQALTVVTQGLSQSSSAIEEAVRRSETQQKQQEVSIDNLTAISAELKNIKESLEKATQQFTGESTHYVNQTLQNFDNGLAEVVERLIFTASAIRDAVDALPVALRPGKDL